MVTTNTQRRAPPNELSCHSVQIIWEPDHGPIVIKHFNQGGGLISEAWLEPEDAFDYAQSVLKAYDASAGIE